MLVLYEGKAQVTLNAFNFCPLGIGAQFTAPSNLKGGLSDQSNCGRTWHEAGAELNEKPRNYCCCCSYYY